MEIKTIGQLLDYVETEEKANELIYYINKQKEVLDKIKEELKKHKSDLDYEPWSEYKISGNILFDIVKILEEIE